MTAVTNATGGARRSRTGVDVEAKAAEIGEMDPWGRQNPEVQASSGNQSAISDLALSSESEACTRFSRLDRE